MRLPARRVGEALTLPSSNLPRRFATGRGAPPRERAPGALQREVGEAAALARGLLRCAW